ncbi:CoA transferase [Thermomonospora cellulosilytica]|uniref:Crotonobetainyl-CoA:carnitine CoA-transferase CaiB-like acyl-CoA transferase n=1 Tax=Thermomonospora cellulosilytica TaxID=1411118 RepID=A0A7W3N2I4_9ACTN|nr:CoA transferase [Thermomonospora cellulosilytica]MBA9006354.1 crotonobetainyl-CoA:carnitine CoA-transferase CaiB-like acyl-CoA transferase [Thermomonospora cellulosilytica]
MPNDAPADWARSGVVALTGRADGPPLVPPGRAASLAAELAERFAARTGVRVDGARLLSERAAFTGHRRRGTVSAGGACRLLPTADGWAAVSCARPDDPALLGALACAEVDDDPWPAVTAWLRGHTGAELAERAELLGVAAGPVVHRETPPPLPEPGPPRPVAGLLVVDFSALWAGPLCAHLLGLAGARVVKVETPSRPDGARRGNRDFYRLLHAGHRSVVLDPGTADGRAAMAALVEAADIVIEASRPRALARFGLDAEAAAAAGTTWISITAYGRGSGRVGFGDDIAAANGLVAYEADGTPLFAGDAIADPLTGLAAAVLAASGDGGRLWDVAMADVVAATLDPGPPRPSTEAGPDGRGGWVVDAPSGPVPVAEPERRRAPAGRAPGGGEHTDEVLRELGLSRG